MQQHREEEERRDREQDRRRIRLDSDPAGDRVQAAAPRRKHEQHRAREQPQEGIAFAEASAANQLEDDEEQGGGGDRGGNRDLERRHLPSSRGTGLRRNEPTSRASSTFTM